MSGVRRLVSWFSLTVGGLMVVSPAVAQPAIPSHDYCGAARWALKGAAAGIGGADASFHESWRADLKQIAGCVTRTACIKVQGRYDALSFSDPVVRAFGSSDAAQMVRASGRAQRVISVLFDYGVPASQMSEVPAPKTPTYRGVEIWLIEGCLSVETASTATQGPPAQPVVERPPPQVARTPTPTPSAPVALQTRAQPPPTPGPFWLQAGSDLSLMVVEPENVFAPVFRLGAGWRRAWFVARIDAGLVLASVEEQRTGLEIIGVLGAAPLPWLEIGASVGHRVGAPSPNKPWLHQAWFVGLEATQCIWSPTPSSRLCLQQSIMPLGQRLRRGEVVGGTIERTQPATDRLVRVGLALTLRALL